MIQSARSSNSRSLLREAKNAILLIEDEKVKVWFEKAISNVVAKREDPKLTFTGAKELKTNLLAYLSQHGEVKTANIWCRKIVYSEIENFLENLEEYLQGLNLNGVVELHLQDREINSPHIQYVGTNAEHAQDLIAQFLVARNYEDSYESAVNNNYTPAYITEEKGTLRVEKTDEEVDNQREIKERTERRNEIRESLKESLDEIRNFKSDFIDELKAEFRENSKQAYQTREFKRVERAKTTDELMSSWQEKSSVRKQRR
ncbi:hypothetical protein KDE13_09075 [Campylobacter sp. faydin G-140]|uniref:hypothetical protein n=1 Tax=Campylobacter anatolicus TaxID=2829105 RepID=UPI001BA09725|nr:hypothetical protein [Campylobacter anatolicus]MBR8466485.1 hypothetical protein [Campylobacter anatolicus]